MSGEIEAAGALATAGLAAKAIEGGGDHGAHGGACLNCETPLSGAFCHQCGQPAHISRTLGEVAHDFAHSVLHFDTRAWRTIPMLFVRPGTLTNRYIHGQRARFISPLALFLFTVFLMFFVFAFAAGPEQPSGVVRERVVTTEDVTRAEATYAKRRTALETAQKEQADVAAEAARRTAAGSDSVDPAFVERQAEAQGGLVEATKEMEEASEALTKLRDRLERQKEGLAKASKELGEAQKEVASDAPVVANVLGAAKARADRAIEAQAAGDAAPKAGAPAPAKSVSVTVGRLPSDADMRKPVNVDVDGSSPDARWQDEMRDAVEDGRLNINTGNKTLDKKVRKSLLNPDLALYKLQQTTYKFSFLLVPISLPFIALLFLWRRGVTFFDHVVFSLYSLSFMSLFALILVLVGRIGPNEDSWIVPIIALSAVFVPPTHMFFHLKGTYALGRWSALWRTLFLSIFVFMAATLFVLAIIFLGLGV